MSFDLSQIIISVLATTATIAGLWVTRKGRKETAIQEAAAARLAEDQLELERFRAMQEASEKMAAAARLEVDRAYAAREAARAEVDRERARRIDAETAADLAVEQARRTARQALADAETLRQVVQDEIAKEATRTAVEIQKAEQPPERIQEQP